MTEQKRNDEARMTNAGGQAPSPLPGGDARLLADLNAMEAERMAPVPVVAPSLIQRTSAPARRVHRGRAMPTIPGGPHDRVDLADVRRDIAAGVYRPDILEAIERAGAKEGDGVRIERVRLGAIRRMFVRGNPNDEARMTNQAPNSNGTSPKPQASSPAPAFEIMAGPQGVPDVVAMAMPPGSFTPGSNPGSFPGSFPLQAPSPKPQAPSDPARFYTAEQLALAETRKAVCKACPHAKKVHQITVACKKCGCAGMSLIRGKCPEQRWSVAEGRAGEQVTGERRENPNDQIRMSNQAPNSNDTSPPGGKPTGGQAPSPEGAPLWPARVVVVNLDRRPDRWEAFQQRMPADWPFPRPERVRAVDGQRCQPPAWWKAGKGSWGIYQTHLRILEAALLDGLDSVLILEDDVTFVDGFAAKVAQLATVLPSDWHQLYLGGQHLKAKKHPPQIIRPGVVRCHNVNRCHAHMLRGDYILAAYQHLTNWPELADQHHKRDGSPWKDDKAHHVDHRMGVLHETRAWNIYAPTEWLAGQIDGKSDISAKDVPVRFWPNSRTTSEPLTPGTRPRKTFLILAHPRSGTKYAAKLMQAFGKRVWHENMGPDGISSWMLAVDGEDRSPYGDGTRRRDFDYETVIHLVRHPLKVLASSMQTESARSLAFRQRWTQPPGDYNEHEQAVHILLEWDRFIREQKPALVIHAERAVDELRGLLKTEPTSPLPPRDVNKRTHKPLTWGELKERLRPELVVALSRYAGVYGYNLEAAQ